MFYRRGLNCSWAIMLSAIACATASAEPPVGAAYHANLPPEDLLAVGSALHYKALCDASLPGYQQRVALDYGRWRASQAKAIAQLESSGEFQKQLAAAKAFFADDQAQATGDELRMHRQAMHRICEVGLVTQFRTGAPVYESTNARPATLQAPSRKF